MLLRLMLPDPLEQWRIGAAIAEGVEDYREAKRSAIKGRKNEGGRRGSRGTGILRQWETGRGRRRKQRRQVPVGRERGLDSEGDFLGRYGFRQTTCGMERDIAL